MIQNGFDAFAIGLIVAMMVLIADKLGDIARQLWCINANLHSIEEQYKKGTEK